MPRWKKTYWAVWVANLVTSIGMMSFLPFFPQHLRSLGMEDPDSIARWSAAIFGAAPFTAGLMMPIWGAIGDRVGRKVMVLRALLAISVFVGLMSFADSALQLFCLRIGQGLFTGFVAPSVTLVSVAAPADRQGQVSGSLQTALAAGSVLGPFLGGWLSLSVGVRGVFVIVASAALIASACVFFLAHEDPAQRKAKTSEGRGIIQLVSESFGDVRTVWANPTLRMVIVSIFLLQFGVGATNPLTEIFVGELFQDEGLSWFTHAVESVFVVEDQSELLTMTTSAMFGGMSLALLVAMPLWGARGDRLGHKRVLLFCSVLSGLALLGHALAPTLALLFAVRVLLGGSVAGCAPSAFGVAASEASIDSRGGAIAAVVSARTFAVSTGALLGGQLVPFIGIRGLYWGGTILVLLSAVALARRAPVRAVEAAS